MTEQIDIVFDGPPDHEAPRFIEVEDHTGRSICAGEWVQRPDGLWALRLHVAAQSLPHYHVAGTTIGKDIDKCAKCGQDIRSDIHRMNRRPEARDD